MHRIAESVAGSHDSPDNDSTADSDADFQGSPVAKRTARTVGAHVTTGPNCRACGSTNWHFVCVLLLANATARAAGMAPVAFAIRKPVLANEVNQL